MISASVVTFYTSQDDLSRLIDSVMASSIDILYIIDHTPIKGLVQYPFHENIVYIPHENLGYGSGHNIAIKKALEEGAVFHIVLNPDVYWQGDVIGELEKFIVSKPEVGLVMPKIVYPDGSTQFLCKLLPTPLDLIGRRFFPIRSFQERHDYRYELRESGYDKVMCVPSLSGCFMFMRCSILRNIGGFDERYFMYAEDLDLCRRFGEISQTVFYPYVSVVHEYEKGSYKNFKLLKYHIVSVVKYFNKWGWFFDRQRKRINKECKKMLNSIK